MNDPSSLDRLHDLALPPEVPWWPLAPGWYLVIIILLIVVTWVFFHAWKRWRSNAYRRAALHELKALETPAAIAELLRRTALAIAPRSIIAEMTGAAWLDWLARQCPELMPESVRIQLIQGVYQAGSSTAEIESLKSYATLWINHHRSVINS